MKKSDPSIETMFSSAIEQESSTPDAAAELYEKVLLLNPDHAGAHINLGTLFYNQRKFLKARHHYECAIRIDPKYSLAYFDLANVFDETGEPERAIVNYGTAIKIAPTYADAHYNMALTLEKVGQPRRALKHWQAYRLLDRGSAWHKHAIAQIKRITTASGLFVIRAKANPRQTKRRARLRLV